MDNHSNRPGLLFLQGFLLGLVSLSTFYYLLLLVITKDPTHPLTQFQQFQPWMSLLILGFGIQMGLFWLMRKGVRFSLQEKKGSQMTAETSTTVSGMAMVACCAHHAVDLLPVLGLSAVALFLSEYQEQLLIFGVLANLAGVSMMLWFITGRSTLIVVYHFLFNKTKEAI